MRVRLPLSAPRFRIRDPAGGGWRCAHSCPGTAKVRPRIGPTESAAVATGSEIGVFTSMGWVGERKECLTRPLHKVTMRPTVSLRRTA